MFKATTVERKIESFDQYANKSLFMQNFRS